MTDEDTTERAEGDEAERRDEELESTELDEADLEKASGGVNPTKTPTSPFQP